MKLPKKLKKILKKPLFLLLLALSILLIVSTILSLFVLLIKPNQEIYTDIIQEILPSPSPTPQPTTPPLPTTHIIPQRLHVFQTFNNCGPATLSMALSYVDVAKSQKELGDILRPYQIPGGDNDDKSVTLKEVSEHAKSYGLVSYLRPNGTINKLKQFLSNDIVVVARTWLKTDEDIGHYRVIRGYDDSTYEIIQDDSLQGKNLRYSYSEFEKLWQPFNYEYLVIVTMNKKELVEKILGEELDENKAWKNALQRVENEKREDPSNWHLTFALSRINYYLKNYKKSIEEFDKVENLISFRTLWYQIEPVYSMFEIGDYDRVLTITQSVLNNQNRAFAEFYILRGDVYKLQGNDHLANSEFEKALLYNSNSLDAKNRLKF